jgi:hypothetical protein
MRVLREVGEMWYLTGSFSVRMRYRPVFAVFLHFLSLPEKQWEAERILKTQILSHLGILMTVDASGAGTLLIA